jgi:hypothetical protein
MKIVREVKEVQERVNFVIAKLTTRKEKFKRWNWKRRKHR